MRRRPCLVLVSIALTICLTLPADAQVEDFAPPAFRGEPLTVTVRWTFAADFSSDQYWIWPYPAEVVGDGVHSRFFYPDWAEALPGVYWRDQLDDPGDGAAATNENPGVLRALVSNFEDTGLGSTIHLQIRYGGDSVPFVRELSGQSQPAPNEWSDPTFGTLLEATEAGPGERVEVWFLAADIERQTIEIEIPPHSWVDDLIVDTIAASGPVPAAPTTWGRLKSLYR